VDGRVLWSSACPETPKVIWLAQTRPSPERRGSPHDPKPERQTLSPKRVFRRLQQRRHATANRFCYCAEIHSASFTTTETPFTTTRSPSSRRACLIAARARHYFRRRTACAVTRSIPYAPLRVRPAITYLTGIEQTIARACSNANTAYASTSSVGHSSRTLQLSAQRLTRRLRHYGSCGPAGQ
jgi:hypothetical protein